MAVEVQGLSELADALRALPKELSGHRGGPLAVGLRKAANVIKDEAKAKAPVKTGLLKKNIIVRRDSKLPPGVNEMFEVRVKAVKKKRADNVRNRRKRIVGNKYDAEGSAFYWRFLEFGTKKMKARPFMRPAFEAKKEAALQTFTTELAKAIDKANAKVHA